MAKAARVLAALKWGGWIEIRRSGSLFFDTEAGNWHYRVPALRINGGGTLTREDAERDCMSAIAFALEGDPRDYDTGAETLTFEVKVAPAA
jgi:hypothetical protein